MVPFAGWEMPVQYEGVIPEHRAVRTDSGVFDVSHMGELEVEGMYARDLLQATLSNDIDKLGVGDAQYTLLTNERGGIVDDLIVYRTDDFRYLLIVNASNRAADFEWLKTRELPGSDVRDFSDEYALLAVQGPRALERLGLEHGKAFTWEMAELDGVEVMVNRTGYTGEEGVELMTPAEEAVALWDAVIARGVTPVGLGARDTLRLEVCFPLHGNDIDQDTDAISAGLGWVCALETDFTGADVLRRVKEEGPSRAPRRLRDDREGDSAAGHVDRGRRPRYLRLAFADARRRHRPRLCAGRAGATRHIDHDRRPRQAARCQDRQEAHLPEGALVAAAESYPEDLKYHAEHDWARIDGDEATLGVTWYAQDALGELVHYEAPETGATIAKDATYGEVESVKAVSDVIAPLSGEIIDVNQKAIDEPETVNEDPYGEGWLVRIRLSEPVRGRAAPGRRGVQAASGGRVVERVPVAHGRRPRGDAGDDRRRLDRRALPQTSRQASVSGASWTSSRRFPSRRSQHTSRSLRGGTPSSFRFSAQASTTTTCRRSPTR